MHMCIQQTLCPSARPPPASCRCAVSLCHHHQPHHHRHRPQEHRRERRGPNTCLHCCVSPSANSISSSLLHITSKLDIAADSNVGNSSFWGPVLLSLLAGGSTSIGGVLAVALPPNNATLSFLLGTAIGVMATVSVVELWWHSAAEQGDDLGVTAAVCAGAALFAVLDPLLPKAPESGDFVRATQPSLQQTHWSQDHVTGSYRWLEQQQQQQLGARIQQQQHHQQQHDNNNSSSQADTHCAASAVAAAAVEQPAAVGAATQPGQHQSDSSSSSITISSSQGVHDDGDTQHPSALASRQASLLRLSVLMAVTMTLHNLPEGVAVAFSAFSDIAPIMVVAVALHNVPEGLICAAPLYAATGSKWQAIGIATASGLSEPVGALLALLFLKPFVRSTAALEYVLAATGGVMLAVCVLELWPEGQRCGRDGMLLAGVLLGTVVMGWTLHVGV